MEGLDDARSGRVVSVFGSSRAREPDAEYQEAMRLGRLLAERGWTVCNGGHDGTMEATARGAREVGGDTIGVTLDFYKPVNRNLWLVQEIATDSLFARLEKLMRLGDAYIVLRGGIGTLLEMCLAWNLVQSPEFSHKPLLVVGPSWASIIREIRDQLPMHPWESSSLTLVDDVDSAVERLEAVFTGTRAASNQERRPDSRRK